MRFIFCSAVDIAAKPLDTDEVDDAKREALLVVQHVLDDLTRKFRDLVIGAK